MKMEKGSVCLLEFYNLATSKVIPELVPTCDIVNSSGHYCPAPLGYQGCLHHGLVSHSVTLP